MDKRSLFWGIGLLGTTFLSASLDDKMGEWFDKMNTVSNTSSSEYLNSQLGVNFLGGRGSVRTTVEDINPIHISLPTFSAGCGGIDYTLGAINIASKDEIKKALKSIASNGVGYAFLLGIETVSPLIASTMKEIQTWANQLNSININSCEIASGLVQGMWPKTQGASDYICAHAATTSPLFDDLIQAKHGCRDDRKKETAALKRAKKNEDFLAGDYNVAWVALQKMSLDNETKQLFINLTGTIVVKDGKIKIFPPKLVDVLSVLELGGKIPKAYKISKNGLDIEEADLSIPIEKSWKSRVYKTLLSIQSKILNESKGESVSLNEEEKNFLQYTHFPIGSLLSLMGQWAGRASEVISLDECAELIAFENTTKLLVNIISLINQRAESLRAIQVDGESLDQYIKQLQQVLKEIRHLQNENFHKVSQKHQMIDYLLNFDKRLKEKERGL